MSLSVVLVTGGSGLIGHGIQRYLGANEKSNNTKKYIFLSSKDCDLRDKEKTRRIFLQYQPEYVIHLAAKVGGLYANMTYPVEFYRDNILMNDTIMELCREFRVKKLISCLSTCVFPDKDYVTYPIDESMIHNGPPHSSNEAYSYAKRNVDVMNRAYHIQYGCNFMSIIPTNVYGTHDNFHLKDSHVLPALIHKAYLAKKNDEDFIVSGSGEPLRQFIYNDDLGEIVVHLLENYDKGPDAVILSPDEKDEISIKDLALLIAKKFDISQNRIKFDTTREDGQYKKTASNAKLRSMMPIFEFTKIEKGISETCEWFMKNYDQIRK